MVKIKIDRETKELQKNAQSFVTKNNYDGDWLKFISYSKNIHNCHPLDVDDNESAYALVSNYIRWIYEDVEAKILKGLSEKEHRKKVSQTQNPYYKSNYKASTVQRILAAITYNYRNHQLSPKSENVGKSIIFDRQNIAMISEATVISNPSSLGKPLPGPPSAHAIWRNALSLTSRTRFQLILLASISIAFPQWM